MVDLELVAHLLSQQCFAEAGYFATVSALEEPTAFAHLLAGAACCGCAGPLATAQRLLEGAPDPDDLGVDGLRISPATELPYEGFFHLIEALRRDRAIKAPEDLRSVLESIADDLAYVSRRELHRPPDLRRRYSLGIATVSAAVLLKRLIGSDRDLPGVTPHTLDMSNEIIATELGRTGGDAAFYR